MWRDVYGMEEQRMEKSLSCCWSSNDSFVSSPSSSYHFIWFNPFYKKDEVSLLEEGQLKAVENCKWKDSNIVIANQLIPFHFEFECDGQFLSSTPNRKELLVLNVCFKCQLQFLRIKSMQSFIWNQIWLQHSIQIPFILGHWLGTISRPWKEKKSRIESNWFWQSPLLCYLLLFFVVPI